MTLSVKHSIIATLVLFTTACVSTSPAKVNSDRNLTVDTSQYKTFAWLTEQKVAALPAVYNPVLKARIDNSIEQAFVAKGYQLVSDAEQADFTISYTVGSRDKIKIDSYPTSYRTGWGWGGRYYGGVVMANETHVRNYTEGSLAIDVFDVTTKQPTWHGWATKRISSSEKENPQPMIDSIVNQLVAQF